MNMKNAERRFVNDDRYSLSNPAYRFMKVQLNKGVRELVDHYCEIDIAKSSVLELGCGNGNVLDDYYRLGFKAENLFGIDLLPMRLNQAYASHPSFRFACADGQNLPYASCSFNLTMQFTVFSSILDDEVKANLAREMLRVTRPGGLILWYDFWLNPTNPQTRGIRPAEIKRLFPNCAIELHKTTLAPPIARRIVPISWMLALFLEKLKILTPIISLHHSSGIKP